MSATLLFFKQATTKILNVEGKGGVGWGGEGVAVRMWVLASFEMWTSENVLSQLFSKYCERYVNLKVRSSKKLKQPLKRLERCKIENGNWSIGPLKGLCTMVSGNFLTAVILKILYNLVSMQNSLNPNNYCGKKNFEKCLWWPYLYF